VKGQDRLLIDRFPPALLIVVSTILFIGGGALTEAYLIEPLGILGASTLQFLVAAVFLIAFSRPNIRNLSLGNIFSLLVFGLSIYIIEVTFFAALEHLPLGVVVTIGFCGPLLVSLVASRSPKDVLWFAAATFGLYLITPTSEFQQSYAMIGYIFALIYSLSIVIYFFLSKRLNSDLSGIQGLAIGMGITAVITLPISLQTSSTLFFEPTLIWIILGIGLFGVVLPYAMDYVAVGKLELKTVGILQSTEPLIGGVIGLLILGEALTLIQLLAFMLIAVASVGSSLNDGEGKKHSDLFIIPSEDLTLTFRQEYDL